MTYYSPVTGLNQMTSLKITPYFCSLLQPLTRTNPLVFLVLLSLFLSTAVTAQSTHHLSGKVSVAGVYNNSFDSWLVGNWGRFETGSDYGENNTDSFGELQLQYAYDSEAFGVEAHFQYRHNSDNSGRELGLVEMKAFTQRELGEKWLMTLTTGLFFLPTTMENVDTFWESPYTLTYSSINSWIATEFRPVGIDLHFEKEADSGHRLSSAFTLFGGNDSMGSQLAWQGWMYHHRRSVYGEELPLPNLRELKPGGVFEDQSDFSSTSYGKDLDNRIGYAIRSSYSIPDELFIQATRVDNRGDRDLHSGEYSWDTQFTMLGMEWRPLIGWVIAAELMQGSTGMGHLTGSHVDVDFWSGYLLASYNTLQWRYTLRLDRFLNDDQDDTPNDLNDDAGDSYTAALIWSYPNTPISVGFEAIRTVTERRRATPKGFFNDGSFNQYMLMISYSF
ncbi:MAG: hypothetical protein ACI92E_000566 [Oceanicoccus sp.]|jgi:hypothetical protein